MAIRYVLTPFWFGLVVLALAGTAWGARATAGQVTVFAAASLKTALDEVGTAFAETTGHGIVHSYAGSSALARQIELGAPADVFLSANILWMDHVAGAGRIDPDTRVTLLGNRLALVAHGPSEALALGPDTPLAALLGGGRLAMALVDAVPAGIYGKTALERLGHWDGIAAQVVQTDNVRAALKLVALGEARLGVVYATDAAAEPGVSVIGLFPEDSHPAIVYPVAAIAGRVTPAVRDYLDFLRGPAARAVFELHGFSALAGGAG